MASVHWGGGNAKTGMSAPAVFQSEKYVKNCDPNAPLAGGLKTGRRIRSKSSFSSRYVNPAGRLAEPLTETTLTSTAIGAASSPGWCRRRGR